MALNANALTTLAMAKTYLKIPTLETSKDTLVEFWINVASQRLEQETNRKLLQQSITEYHHGRASNLLLLREWPIASLPYPQVFLDMASQFPPSSEIASSEIHITDDANSLLLAGRQFPRGYHNIKVVYTAGYATVPPDLENACLWLVSWYDAARENKDIGRESKTKGDETTSFLQDAPKDVRDTLLNYKRTEVPSAWAPVFNT